MPIHSSQELLAVKLRHIEDAETQAAPVLQEMRDQVENADLQELLDRRIQEGEMVLQGVRDALPQMAAHSDAMPENLAARGIVQEARSFLSEIEEPQLRQAVAIGSIQSLEHYCLATWGTVKALAEEMGQQRVVDTMQRALDSAKQLDQDLTDIAEGWVNPEALQADQEQQQ